MTGPGNWRVRLCTCAYLLVATTTVGYAAAALWGGDQTAVATVEQAPEKKIGPGMTRMPPMDFGKPEKVADHLPYLIPIVRPADAPRVKREAVRIAPLANASAPLFIAEVAQPAYRAPDIHKVY